MSFKTVLFCYAILFLFHMVASQQCKVIKDEVEARKCFNLTNDDIAAPLPINFADTIPGPGNYICNDTKPYFYAFFCNLYSTDLIWYYNGRVVSTFHASDAVGTTYKRTFPEPPEKPVHNITTTLTELNVTASEKFNISASFCSSTLTIQPFDDDDFEVIPFNVFCLTHCSDENYTAICQSQHYEVAAKPKKPTMLTQNTNRIVGNQGSIPSAVASIDWDSSNDTDTNVVSYNLTLVNTKTFDNLYVSLHNSSFTEVVSDGNYSISVSAIDLCRQQSEPATLMFHVEAAGLTTPQPCSEERLKMRFNGLAAGFTITTVVLLIVIVILSVCLVYQCQKQGSTENNVSGKKYGTY